MIHVPEWMSKKPPEQEAAGGIEPGQEVQAEQALPEPPFKAAPAKPRSTEILRPLLAIRDGRVAVSLDYVWCGVLGLALVTLVLAVFLLGWKLGAGSAPGPGVPVPEKRDVLGEKDAARPKPRPPAPERVVGKYYMLIQGVEGMTEQHKAEAERIVEFCQEAGLQVDIGQMLDPDQYVVWSLTGFDSPDSQEAKEYARRVRELGKKYKAKYGTYELRQAYPSGDWPWFHQYRPRR